MRSHWGQNKCGSPGWKPCGPNERLSRLIRVPRATTHSAPAPFARLRPQRPLLADCRKAARLDEQILCSRGYSRSYHQQCRWPQIRAVLIHSCSQTTNRSRGSRQHLIDRGGIRRFAPAEEYQPGNSRRRCASRDARKNFPRTAPHNGSDSSHAATCPDRHNRHTLPSMRTLLTNPTACTGWTA
jgi:hypothetical protein